VRERWFVARWLVAGAAALGASCGQSGNAPPPSPQRAINASLGGVVVAKVGDVTISRALVTAIAHARRLSAKEALDAAIEGALLAEAATRARAVDDANLRRELDAVLTRALAAKIRAQALAEGPFDDAEIAAAAANHPDLSHPELRITVHALVRNDVPNAESVAKELRARLLEATGDDAKTSEQSFSEKAKAFPMPPGHTLVIESLPAITVDGRVFGSKERLEEAFARAAFAVPKPLGTSEIAHTSYGWHVIRVLESMPAYEATREDKLAKLEPQLVATRVKKLWDPLLERLHAESKPDVLATDGDLAAPRVQ
jgi:hypothetical protein